MLKTRLDVSRKTATPYFIAEIGANHDQSFDRLVRLVTLAKSAGADAIKLQHLTAKNLGSKRGFDEVVAQFGNQISQHDAFKIHPVDAYQRAEIDKEWTRAIASLCKDLEIDFLSSPYSLSDLEHIAPYVDAIKLGSGELTNIELIQATRDLGLPVILSTGASNLNEVCNAVELFASNFRQLVLMQCNSDYSGATTALRHINLKVLSQYRLMWPHVDLGISDHTRAEEVISLAIGLGALVVERHFTDDTSRAGADHKIAMEPDAWSRMIQSARRSVEILGTGNKRVEPNESRSRITQRRALRAARDIEVGELLSRVDLSVLRPAPPTAIQADFLGSVVGTALAIPIKKDEILTWNHVPHNSEIIH